MRWISFDLPVKLSRIAGGPVQSGPGVEELEAIPKGRLLLFVVPIELKPDFEQAHYNLALALHNQGDASNSEKELAELKGLHEFRARLAQSKLLILQGVDALKKQQFDEAIALFQKSAELTPELPTSYYYLGLTWEGKNDAVRARREAYEKAIELKPDYAQAHASPGIASVEVRGSNARAGRIPARRHVRSGSGGSALQSRARTRANAASEGSHSRIELTQSASIRTMSTRRVQFGLVLSQNNDTAASRQYFSRPRAAATQSSPKVTTISDSCCCSPGRFRRRRRSLPRQRGSSQLTPKRTTISPWRFARKAKKPTQSRNSSGHITSHRT